MRQKPRYSESKYSKLPDEVSLSKIEPSGNWKRINTQILNSNPKKETKMKIKQEYPEHNLTDAIITNVELFLSSLRRLVNESCHIVTGMKYST